MFKFFFKPYFQNMSIPPGILYPVVELSYHILGAFLVAQW